MIIRILIHNTKKFWDTSNPENIIVFDNWSCYSNFNTPNELDVKNAVLKHPDLKLYRQIGAF